MALLRRHNPAAPGPIKAPSTVRVLHGESELAAAVERARDGARRLQDRLDARAAREAWMAGLPARAVEWRRFSRTGGAVGDAGSSRTPAA